jgi:hypothetical protein
LCAVPGHCAAVLARHTRSRTRQSRLSSGAPQISPKAPPIAATKTVSKANRTELQPTRATLRRTPRSRRPRQPARMAETLPARGSNGSPPPTAVGAAADRELRRLLQNGPSIASAQWRSILSKNAVRMAHPRRQTDETQKFASSKLSGGDYVAVPIRWPRRYAASLPAADMRSHALHRPHELGEGLIMDDIQKHDSNHSSVPVE